MNNKIKALLLLHGENITSYASYTNRSQSNVSNKVARESWNAKDLILLAEMTNTRLAFIDKDNNPVIIFGKEDIKKDLPTTE